MEASLRHVEAVIRILLCSCGFIVNENIFTAVSHRLNFTLSYFTIVIIQVMRFYDCFIAYAGIKINHVEQSRIKLCLHLFLNLLYQLITECVCFHWFSFVTLIFLSIHVSNVL